LKRPVPRDATVSASARAGGLLAATGIALALHGCAAASTAPSGKYPRRGPGCEIALYHTAVPGAALWDDLGIAEVACHVNGSISQCLQRLKAEGCSMGGDMIYNVPREPMRPQDQVLVFRGQVAHSRPGNPHKDSEEADLPPPASKEESNAPVVPLTGRAAPPAADAAVEGSPKAP